mmetsp:Transcript_15039/g.29099  ORF Transcript_15039/g.29099 Transcript_15039/m.29099 type:complete len:245 (-) Transcript_15039:65-799(-)
MSRGGDHSELLQLRSADDNCKAVHKSHHDWLRHKPNELPEPQSSKCELNDSAENDRTEEVLDAVFCAQRRKHHGCCTCSARYDAVLRPEDCGEESHCSRSVKADDGRHPSHERKSKRLGNHRQRRRKTCKNVHYDVRFPLVGFDGLHCCGSRADIWACVSCVWSKSRKNASCGDGGPALFLSLALHLTVACAISPHSRALGCDHITFRSLTQRQTRQLLVPTLLLLRRSLRFLRRQARTRPSSG